MFNSFTRPRQYAVAILELPEDKRSEALQQVPEAYAQIVQLHMQNFCRVMEPWAQMIAGQPPRYRAVALEKISDAHRAMVRQRVIEIVKHNN